jgi:hypothetical protein
MSSENKVLSIRRRSFICRSVVLLGIAKLWANSEALMAKENRSLHRNVIMHVVPWLPPGVYPPLEEGLSNLSLPQSANSQTNYENHVAAMSKRGVDVVALDVQVRSGWRSGLSADLAVWQQGHAEAWMQAMAKVAPSMRFCFCLDRAGDRATLAEEWAPAIDALLKYYGTQPFYFKENGKPVMLSFFLNEFVTAEQWSVIRQQIKQPVILIGDVLEAPNALVAPKRAQFDEKAMIAMGDSVDGLSASPLGSHISWIKTSFPRLAAIAHKRRKEFVWGVAPGYYRKGTAFIEPQFIYLDQTWRMAIASQDQNVVIYTWNDIQEDTDCWPSVHKGQALLELHAFYAQWFHTRQMPILNRDLLFVNYPTTNSGRRVPSGGENPTFPQLGYWAYLRQPAHLEFVGLGAVELDKGLSIGHLGAVVPGLPVQYTLKSGKKVLMSGKISEPMVEQKTGENLTYRWCILHDLV